MEESEQELRLTGGQIFESGSSWPGPLARFGVLQEGHHN